ncbi:MAG: hypothetical protein KC931_09715, partial [Candidatus Omnitrophica bacterium]|nr:hypothetical protein [Candidatus Omnitrophota bacterium]
MRPHSSVLIIGVCSLSNLVAFGQVFDVDGDQKVGPHEAIAVVQEWKQETVAPDAHDHLGQTWTGEGSPLKLRGGFEERVIPIQADASKIGILPFQKRPSAPLILESTSSGGYGLKVSSKGLGIQVSSEGPDLILTGNKAIIAATDDDYENLSILCDNNVYLHLDHNQDNPHTSGFYIFGRNGFSVFELSEDGNLWIKGTLTASNFSAKEEKAGGTLPSDRETSGEPLDYSSGNVLLDEKGEAWVPLPPSLEACHTDFRYHLTCVGGFAPVHVAEEVKDNRFKISGGTPGLKVSWQVSGVRQIP